MSPAAVPMGRFHWAFQVHTRCPSRAAGTPAPTASITPLPTVPDVPPFATAANAPDFEAVSWHILFAPSATPKDIVERLHREMSKIMSDPEMQKRAANIGLLPLSPPSIQETQKYLASERDKWGTLVRKLGLAGTL